MGRHPPARERRPRSRPRAATPGLTRRIGFLARPTLVARCRRIQPTTDAQTIAFAVGAPILGPPERAGRSVGAEPRAHRGHRESRTGRHGSTRMELSTEPQTLTVEEAAKVLRIGRTAAYALAREWRTTKAGAASRSSSSDVPSGCLVPRWRRCSPARRHRVRRRLRRTTGRLREAVAEPTRRSSGRRLTERPLDRTHGPSTYAICIASDACSTVLLPDGPFADRSRVTREPRSDGHRVT